MKFGSFEIFSVETGRFRLDGGAMFGVVPKNLWNKSNPADEQNRIELALRTLLIRKNDQLILVDTGIGEKLSSKLNEIYGVDYNIYSLHQSLQSLGIAPEEIDHVIITHLHFDHCGGAVKKEERKLLPVFPNARYHIQTRQWEWALNPSDRDRASYFPENYLPLKENNVLELIDGDSEILPGISVITVNGHTFGQQLVRLIDGNLSLLYCGDLMPTASHVPAPYIMGYDLQPMITLEEKNKLLEKIVDEQWLLYFEHDPFYECATVTHTGKGFAVAQKGSLKDIFNPDAH